MKMATRATAARMGSTAIPPLRGRKVLGIDPGYRTGCKLTIVDETGKYIDSDTMYLHQSEKAQQQLRALLARHNIDVIAIGNGTASRETEQLVASLIRELEQLARTPAGGQRKRDPGPFQQVLGDIVRLTYANSRDLVEPNRMAALEI